MAMTRILLTALAGALLSSALQASTWAATTCNSATNCPQAKPQQIAVSASPRAVNATKPARTRKAASSVTAQPAAARGSVMQGHDTIALVARLPWWRAGALHAYTSKIKSVESPVLGAADAWFMLPYAGNGNVPSDNLVRLASADEATAYAAAENLVVDANEVNDIDLMAGDPPGDGQSWFHAFLAMLGGALAAASTARFLFV